MAKKRRRTGLSGMSEGPLIVLSAVAGLLLMLVQGRSVKLVGILCCLAVLVLLFRKRKEGASLPLTPLFAALLAFTVYSALSLIWASSGYHYLREYAKILIAFAVFVSACLAMKPDKASLRRGALLGAAMCAVLAFLAADSLSVGIFGFLSKPFGQETRQALFDNSFAGLFMVGAFLSAYLLESAEGKGQENLGAVLLSFSLFGFVLTCNYGSIIAFIPAFALWLVFSRDNRALSFLRFSGALVPSLVFGAIACAFLGGRGVLSALPLVAILVNAVCARELSVVLCRTIGKHDKFRLPILCAAFITVLFFVIILFVYKEDLSRSFGATALTGDGLTLFRSSPVVGLGMGGFSAEAATVMLTPYSDGSVGNQMIQTLMEGGIPGLVLYLLCFVAAVIALIRRPRDGDPLCPALWGAVVMAFLSGLFSGVLTNAAFAACLGLVLALTYVSRTPARTPEKVPSAGAAVRIPPIAAAVLCGVFAVLLLLSSWAGSTASHLTVSDAKDFKKLETCIALDIFDGDAHRAAYIKNADNSPDDYYDKAVVYGDRLLKRSSTGEEEALMTFFSNYSDFERSAAFALMAVRYNRLDPAVWEKYLGYCYQYSMNGFGVMMNPWEQAFYACGSRLMTMLDELNSQLDEPLDIDDKYDVEYREFLANTADMNK